MTDESSADAPADAPAAEDSAAVGSASAAPAVSEPAVSEPAVSEPAVSDAADSEPAVSDPAGSDPAAPQPAVSEPPSFAAALGPRFERFVAGLARPVVFFDIEATGTDPLTDRIIEISMVRVSPAPVGVEPPRTYRVDPGVRIPVEATEVHGIVNDDLSGAPSFREIAPAIAEVFEGADLAGFAIGRFDVRILQQEFQRANHAVDLTQRRVLDSQVIFHQREPRHLAAALQFYRGKPLVDAHGAEADTVASLEVFAGQLERYEDLALDVDALHLESSQGSDAFCDGQRRFQWRDNEPAFNFGRLRGTALRWVAADPEERRYLKWFLEGSFDEDAKAIVRDALAGRIRRRPVPARPGPSPSTPPPRAG